MLDFIQVQENSAPHDRHLQSQETRTQTYQSDKHVNTFNLQIFLHVCSLIACGGIKNNNFA